MVISGLKSFNVRFYVNLSLHFIFIFVYSTLLYFTIRHGAPLVHAQCKCVRTDGQVDKSKF